MAFAGNSIFMLRRNADSGAAPFSPSDLSNLELWLDANDSDSVVAYGAADFTAANTESLSRAIHADLQPASSPFAVCLWMNLNEQPVSDRFGFVGTADSVGEAGEWGIVLNSGSYRFYMGATYAQWDPNPTQTWSFVYAQADGSGNSAISINNETLDTGSYTAPINPSNTFKVGGSFNAQDCYMQQVMTWKGALPTSADITAIYNAGAGAEYSDITFTNAPDHVWPLNEYSDGSGAVTRKDIVGSLDLTDNNTVTTAAGKFNDSYLQDGVAVSQNSDLDTDTAYNVTQATLANMCTYQTAVQNSLPALEYDGTGDYLTNAAFDALDGGAGAFICGVYQCDVTTGTRTLLDTGAQQIRVTVETNELFAYVGGTGNYAKVAFTNTNAFILSVVYDGGGAANADRLKVYVDGVAQSLSFTGTIPATMTTGAGIWEGANETPTNYFDGDRYELHVCSAANTALRASDEAYLQAKWATPALP